MPVEKSLYIKPVENKVIYQEYSLSIFYIYWLILSEVLMARDPRVLPREAIEEARRRREEYFLYWMIEHSLLYIAIYCTSDLRNDWIEHLLSS